MSSDVAALKQQAAEKAVEWVESGMVVGLGTGSTAVHATRRIGQLLRDGRLHDLIAIPTSNATAREAESWRIPLTTFDDHPQIDLTIDGADEVDPALNLIKGLGGALLREKIVAAVTKQFIIVADERKRVTQLGSRAPVPVEVVPFAQRPAADYLTSLGAKVALRMDEAGERPYYTDENNLILDCHFGPIADPHALDAQIRRQPGVVEHGLFLGMAARAVIASASGIEILTQG